MTENASVHLVSKDVQHTFGFVTSQFEVKIGETHGFTPTSHEIDRFHSVFVYTDFMHGPIGGAMNAPILKCFIIERSPRATMMSKSLKYPEFRKLLKQPLHSITVE